MDDYRSRIYENYASNMQNRSLVFDEADSRIWRKGYTWWLRNWLPEDKNARILEVACGSGMLLHYFKDLGYKNIYGVDISPDQVELARQVIPQVTLGSAIDYLEAHPDEFDLIVGLDLIEHFYKDELLRFLDNCYAALKEHGRVILQTLNAETPWGLTHRYGDLTHELGFTPDCLRRLLELTGFSDPESIECGPAPVGLKGNIRFVLWKMIWLGIAAYNYIEAGHNGSGIYTRIFLISAKKQTTTL